MRSRFAWYLSPTDAEVSEVWATGVLTVDANVLLDLYRYHEQTRASLFQALQGFQGRAWISDQAATEFFDNRKAVIAQADTTFMEANKAISELATAVDTALSRLRGYRLIPRDALEEIGTDVKAQVAKALAKVAETKASHPNYLKSDHLLEDILSLFDGRIGATPRPEDLATLHEEAARRQAAKIPPGYLDRKKDGDRAFGDYILWRQALDHAKAEAKPLILVTSEQKADWWEEQSARRVGPRPELLKEAFEHTGQRVLIYQTENFLKEAGERLTQLAGAQNLPESVAEIRDVSRRRDASPAVKVEHIAESSDYLSAAGIICVQLARPVRNFTASVSLEGDWTGAEIQVIPLEVPTDLPDTFLRAHIDYGQKLHVHFHASSKDELLEVGDYYFSYEVSNLSSKITAEADSLEQHAPNDA